MSEAINQARCHCGKTFKSPAAMGQHLRDSPNHPPENNVPPPAPKERTGCSCGRNFKSGSALQQHRRDSPRHAREALKVQAGEIATASQETCANEPKENIVRPSDSAAEQLKATRDKKNKGDGKAKKNQKAKYTSQPAYSPGSGVRSQGLWWSSTDWDSDKGDNFGLCDKDCGWCGHCADGYDFDY
ncbi:hypothetical protein HDV57DRAFT_8729 [Trichoderma longibrachiatum]